MIERRVTSLVLGLSLLLALAACTTQVTPIPWPTQAPGISASPTPGILDPGVSDSTPQAVATEEAPLAARVNGQPVYLDDYQRQVSQYEAALQAAGQDLSSPEAQQELAQTRQQLLNWMIERVLLLEAAAQQGISVSDAEVDAELQSIIDEVGVQVFEARLAAEGTTREEIWQELRTEMVGAAVMDQVVGAVPVSGEHVHARHILVATEEEANRILNQLQAGADFVTLAQTYSLDVSTREGGGDLGFFPRGILTTPEVEEAAFNLLPGQTSGVIHSVLGYHVVQVIEREPSRELSPDNLLLLQEQAVQAWLEGLWAQAVVERYVQP